MTTKQYCPRCGCEITEYPALSRRDNQTDICSRCGQLEATADMMTLADADKTLPEYCYADNFGQTVMVTRGLSGYIPCPNLSSFREMNRRMNITDLEHDTMLSRSMFVW